VNFLAFAADGKSLISASRASGDYTVSRWDVQSGKEEAVLQTDGYENAIYDIMAFATSADTKTIVWMRHSIIGQYQCRVHVFDAGKRSEAGQVAVTNPASSFALSPDGKFYVAQKDDDSFFLGGIPDGKEVRTLHPSLVAIPTFSQDGKLVAIAGEDGLVRLVSASTGQTVRTVGNKKDVPPRRTPYRDPYETVNMPIVAFSADRRMLATAARGEPLVVWEIATGLRRLEFKGAYQPTINEGARKHRHARRIRP
jgi:WD40 repeat protein